MPPHTRGGTNVMLIRTEVYSTLHISSRSNCAKGLLRCGEAPFAPIDDIRNSSIKPIAMAFDRVACDDYPA